MPFDLAIAIHVYFSKRLKQVRYNKKHENPSIWGFQPGFRFSISQKGYITTSKRSILLEYVKKCLYEQIQRQAVTTLWRMLGPEPE